MIFEEGSAVRTRQIEQAKAFEEVHIILFSMKGKAKADNGPWPSSLKISDNCRVYPTDSRSKFLYAYDAIKIGREIVKEREVNEITCQDASLTAMAGVCLKKKFKIPLEIQIHEDFGSPNYAYNLTNRMRRVLAKRYIPQADRVRVVSERVKYFVEKLLSARPGKGKKDVTHPLIEVRPIPVDNLWITNTPVLVDLHRKYRQFDKIVFMASRLEKEKNIQSAIKAWPEVLKVFPKAGLLVVGRGSLLSGLESLVSNLGLSPSVVFEDWADRPTLVSYYKTADLFLNASLFEGYGMTLVEAKAAGCPIVSTDVGVAKEIGATLCGFKPEEMAATIIEALKKDNLESK